MEGGRIRFSGLASELRDHPDLLRSAYLLRGSKAQGPLPETRHLSRTGRTTCPPPRRASGSAAAGSGGPAGMPSPRRRSCPGPPRRADGPAGEGHEPGTRDAVGEQPAVARVDQGIRAAMQDERAGTDAPLPVPACIPCSRGRLGRTRRRPLSGSPGAPADGHEFWTVPGRHLPTRRFPCDGASAVMRAAEAIVRTEAAWRGRRRATPGRCTPGQDSSTRSGWLSASSWATMPPRLAPSTWARRMPVSSTATISPAMSATVNESARLVAVPDAAVVHQHEPEVPPQFPQHRFPAEPVQAHPLDQDQPRPPLVHGPAQFVGDPQRAAAGVPGPVHLAHQSVHISSMC